MKMMIIGKFDLDLFSDEFTESKNKTMVFIFFDY